MLAAGGDPAKCTFAGVGKSGDEIGYTLEQRVHSFNVESEAELDTIERIARAKKMRAPIALRVNPDVDPHTHQYHLDRFPGEQVRHRTGSSEGGL